ncbi:uncharacterized protein LOC110627803 isoform X1 [Manihot esculenta]|uniref:Peptidylprolyl isomerase n=1 Tax=Manihot esculenta TaxID=3983 RepID=A0A2C9UVZ5_MANES|nr:uncharacterized protein LOC110627803 isoform X1 [Manihot esculenta]
MATRSLNRILATVMISSAALSLTPKPAFAYLTHPASTDSIIFDAKEKMKTMGYHSFFTKKDHGSSGDKGNEMHDEIKCGNVVSRLFQTVIKDYKCPTLDHSVSELNKTNCGTFPLEKGKLLKQVLEDENYHVEKMYSSEVWYRDVKKGKGAIATDDQILQLRIHCNLYNDAGDTLFNSLEHNTSSVEVHLCDHIFGPGVVKAIKNMRVGGIRRIILPKKYAPASGVQMISKRGAPNIKAYGVMDVELVAVCASPVCCS